MDRQEAGTAAPERRYCRDCRWFSPDVTKLRPSGSRTSIEFGKCLAPLAEPKDDNRFLAPEFEDLPYASVMRGDRHNCGPEAKWFEPKPAASTQEAA